MDLVGCGGEEGRKKYRLSWGVRTFFKRGGSQKGGDDFERGDKTPLHTMLSIIVSTDKALVC